jgi:hypothetical protein
MSLQAFIYRRPFTAGEVEPLVPCESCSWPMRLILVAPLWDSGDAETHTYECGCCKHRQAVRLPLKQHAAVVAAPKPTVQEGGTRATTALLARCRPAFVLICRSQTTGKLERSLEVSGLQR